MPGHKRNIGIKEFADIHEPELTTDPFQLDITEVEGFDDLHNATGIIKDITDEIEKIYTQEHPEIKLKAFISVNGSTACNLAALNSISEGDAVLISKDCHRSVFNGVRLSGKRMIELSPAHIADLDIYGGVDREAVKKAFQADPAIGAVVITSPTYEGFVSDIREIADIVHENGAKLIVDEAHGAHFPFMKEAPESALYLGADIVIHSIHKTVGSLNQTAVAFVTDESLYDVYREKLLMFMTTSPSYMLMASIQAAAEWADEHREAFRVYSERLLRFREQMKNLAADTSPNDERAGISDHKGLNIIDKSMVGNYNIFDIDPSKLVFYSNSTGGEELYYSFYNEHKLQFEKYGKRYALAMTTVHDTDEGFERLLRAAEEIDRELKKK